jgi:hypothetical protein
MECGNMTLGAKLLSPFNPNFHQIKPGEGEKQHMALALLYLGNIKRHFYENLGGK